MVVRISQLPPWFRYGLIAGVIAAGATLAANLAINIPRPADLCRVGPLSLVLLNLGALVVFLWMAAAAGFAAARADGSVLHGALAGLVVGVVSGCALVALSPFAPALVHRLAELNSLCPEVGSIGSGATPPPGLSVSPPPDVFTQPFASPDSTAGYVAGLVGTILTGVGLAAGAGALAGLIGAARRKP